MPPPTAVLAPATTIPPVVVAPITANAPVAVNPPIVDAPHANNDNAWGQPLNAARNVPVVEMKFEDVENYMVEKGKKESLELV